MRIVETFNPATSTSNTFNAGFSGGTGKLVIYNESNINLQLSWGSFSTYCPAWTAMLYCITTNSVNITWTAQSQLSSNNAPISQVIVEAYDTNEPVLGTYPQALMRQTNIGNAINVGAAATNIQNDGNAPGTQIIEATPSDTSSVSTWLADTSGNLTIKSDNAGVLTTLLQLIGGASPAVKLAAAGLLTELLGPLQVDGNTISGPSSGNLNLISPNNIFFQVPSGSNEFSVKSDGPHLEADSLHFLSGSISRFQGGSASGTSGTVTHTLGAQPTFVIITPISGSPQSGSVNTINSTTFDWYTNGGSGIYWLAVAL